MAIYMYDGSFTGLLTAMYDIFKCKDKPIDIVPIFSFQESLLDSSIEIHTDIRKADILLRAILNNISENALLNIFHVYLSEMPGSGMSIYRYLDMGWRVGKKLDLYMSDERVLAVQNMCRRVLGEDHRMLGLIRFSHLMGDIYYAPVEPDFNIIALMAPHFLKRLPSQCWIIHDVKRSIAVLYNKKSWTISDFMLGERPSLEEDEKFVRSLWKEYHKCISISERLNPSLQRRNMPIRYWKYLTELSAR